MLQTIFHHRLQQHAWYKGFQRFVVDLLDNFQIVFAEPRHFDVQVVVDKLQFFFERYKRFVLAQQPPQDIAELEHYATGGVGIEADQRRNGIQRVEQKVWIDLTGQRVHARFLQQLLVPLEVHLDASVVPDLQRRGHRHQRGNYRQAQPPIPMLVDGKQPFRLGRQDQPNAPQLQTNARAQRQHFPGNI